MTSRVSSGTASPSSTHAAVGARCDAARDRGGIPSRALMQRAGAAAAAEIALRFGDVVARGVVVATGPATTAATDGSSRARCTPPASRVRVVECVAARTPDAIAERDVAIAAGVAVDDRRRRAARPAARTSSSTRCSAPAHRDGALRGDVAHAVDTLHASCATRGAIVVALDVPTGVDATHGGTTRRRCAPTLTITFGTIKRGHLVARGACGDDRRARHRARRARAQRGDARCTLVDARRGSRDAAARSPPTRTRARARRSRSSAARREWPARAMLAARAALRSGAGMVRSSSRPRRCRSCRRPSPRRSRAAWPTDDATVASAIAEWADGVLIGPARHATQRARDRRACCSRVFEGPVVLDADALNAFAGDADALARADRRRARRCSRRIPAEFARLVGVDVDDGARAIDSSSPRARARRRRDRAAQGRADGRRAPHRRRRTSCAAGTPVLATGGERRRARRHRRDAARADRRRAHRGRARRVRARTRRERR